MSRTLKRRFDDSWEKQAALPTPQQSSNSDPDRNPPGRLRERLALFREKEGPGAKSADSTSDPAPAPANPTAAYFQRLKEGPDAGHRGHVGNKQGYYPTRNSSSPPLPSDKPSSIARVQAAYIGKAGELEARIEHKLDTVRAQLETKAEELKKGDKDFVNVLSKHQKYTGKPLSYFKIQLPPVRGPIGDGRPQEAPAPPAPTRRLGDVAEDLRTKLKACECELPKLWDEWEVLNNKVNRLCEHLLVGGDPATLTDGVAGPGASRLETGDDQEAAALVAEVNVQVSRVIADADAELKELGDAAIRAATRAEKELRVLWEKHKAAIMQSVEHAADRAIFG